MSTDLQAKKKVGYKLPIRLIRAVKDEANRSDLYPSHVIETAIEEYLERQRMNRRRPRPDSAA